MYRASLSRIPWKSHLFWQRLGYTLTAVWMMGVLTITNEDVHHPLFKFIFIVPLAGWIIGLIAARIVRRFLPPTAPPSTPPDRLGR